MENITLKEHRMENEFFEKKDFQFAAVVEFRIENFGISDFLEEDQKRNSNSSSFYYVSRLADAIFQCVSDFQHA